MGDRHYLIRLQPKTLKQIDKPRPTLYHNLVAHPSELRWARPIDDRYHFNKFPQEIKDLIFGFVLSVPGRVSPFTVRSNWKTNYCQPHYDLYDQLKFSEASHYSSIVWIVSKNGCSFQRQLLQPWYLHGYYHPPIHRTSLITFAFHRSTETAMECFTKCEGLESLELTLRYFEHAKTSTTTARHFFTEKMSSHSK